MQDLELKELTMEEVEQVNGGGGWFGGLLLGTAIGEVWGDWKSNPSSYGGKYEYRNLMHSKF